MVASSSADCLAHFFLNFGDLVLELIFETFVPKGKTKLGEG